jgi:hypothetical protein
MWCHHRFLFESMMAPQKVSAHLINNFKNAIRIRVEGLNLSRHFGNTGKFYEFLEFLS